MINVKCFLNKTIGVNPMDYLNNKKLHIRLTEVFFVLFFAIGVVGHLSSKTQLDNVYILSSSDEEQPYEMPCNSIETCFTIA